MFLLPTQLGAHLHHNNLLAFVQCRICQLAAAKGTFQRQTPLICVAEINNNLFLPKLQTHQKTKG